MFHLTHSGNGKLFPSFFFKGREKKNTKIVDLQCGPQTPYNLCLYLL